METIGMIIIQMGVPMEFMEMDLQECRITNLIISIPFKERKKDAHVRIQSALNYIANALRGENTAVHIAIVEIVKIIVIMNQ